MDTRKARLQCIDTRSVDATGRMDTRKSKTSQILVFSLYTITYAWEWSGAKYFSLIIIIIIIIIIFIIIIIPRAMNMGSSQSSWR